jgi:hypothetical protein
MLNVRDECDLPEDDGYDLFTRETEVERRRRDKAHFGARRNRCPAPLGREIAGDVEDQFRKAGRVRVNRAVGGGCDCHVVGDHVIDRIQG